MIKHSLYMLTLLIAIAHPFQTALATDKAGPDQPHIIAAGLGVIEQVPDLITLRFDVSATADTFSQAKQQVDTIIAKAIKAARRQAVPEAQINASKINASPQYEWRNNQRYYKGEQVNRLVEIKLTDPERYNDLVDGLLSAGISRLQPVQLEFSQRAALEAQALLLALDDARSKAELMAGHLGSSVKGVYQITTAQSQPVMGRLAMSARSSEDAATTAPLALGKQAIEQHVQVIFLLGR